MLVSIHRLEDFQDRIVAQLLWDGQSLTADPADSPEAELIIQDGRSLDDKGNPVSPDDKESWLEGLHRIWRGTYFWVGKAKEESVKHAATLDPVSILTVKPKKDLLG